MKTLILMRHAKSGWAEPGMGDHDRRLNEHGRATVPVMARWLDEQGLRPERVLCSPARRTCETATLMREAVPSLPEPDLMAELYLASPGALRQQMARLPGDCDSALIIGHEPGLGTLLGMLVASSATPDTRRACSHFPTAAMAVLEADVSGWADFSAEAAELVAFAAPRELMEKSVPRD